VGGCGGRAARHLPPRFRKGDLTRANPATDFRRWRDRLGNSPPRRVGAELPLGLVSTPTPLVAALASDVGKHRMPALTFFCTVFRWPRPAADHQTQLTVGKLHGERAGAVAIRSCCRAERASARGMTGI